MPSHVTASLTYPDKKRNYVSRVSCPVPVRRPVFVCVAGDVVVVGGWGWGGWGSCIIIKRRKLMKNEMGSFFAFLFTELKLPLIHTQTLTFAPLSHTGNTKFIFVLLETGPAA